MHLFNFKVEDLIYGKMTNSTYFHYFIPNSKKRFPIFPTTQILSQSPIFYSIWGLGVDFCNFFIEFLLFCFGFHWAWFHMLDFCVFKVSVSNTIVFVFIAISEFFFVLGFGFLLRSTTPIEAYYPPIGYYLEIPVCLKSGLLPPDRGLLPPSRLLSGNSSLYELGPITPQ